MVICGNFLKENKKLAKHTIVATMMTNLHFTLMEHKKTGNSCGEREVAGTVMFLKICWKRI